MMSDMQTLACHYEKFAKANVPEDASSYQRRDLKNAFYAGSIVMMLMMLELAEMKDDADARAFFNTIEQEVGTSLTK
jgi:hypothetical protein